MKTAMQELIEFLEPELEMGDLLQLPAYEKALYLLEKEKQQIIDAYDSGYNQVIDINECNNPKFYTPEQYYNETFKKD